MKQKLIVRVFAVILALLLTGSVLAGVVSSVSAAESSQTPAQKTAAAMQPGWNLGNALDAFGNWEGAVTSETVWGNPPTTREMIQKIAADGFKSVRIPITWEPRTEGAPDYTIDPAFMERVAEIVNWCLEEDLYVMINLHHDSSIWLNQMTVNYDQAMKRFKAYWEQIADYFKDYPDKLLFESINEPFMELMWSDVPRETLQAYTNDLNDAFYQIVRHSGGNNAERILVLPTTSTDNDQAICDSLYGYISSLPDADRIIATVHYYGPWVFQDQHEGYEQVNEAVIAQMETELNRPYQTFMQNGIALIIGEYGLLYHQDKVSDPQKQQDWFEAFLSYCHDRQITHMIWDDGGCIGNIMDRNTLERRHPEIYQLVMEYAGNSSNGDINGDGKVTLADLMLALQAAAGKLSLNSQQLAAGDLNGDQSITIVDLSMMLLLL